MLFQTAWKFRRARFVLCFASGRRGPLRRGSVLPGCHSCSFLTVLIFGGSVVKRPWAAFSICLSLPLRVFVRPYGFVVRVEDRLDSSIVEYDKVSNRQREDVGQVRPYLQEFDGPDGQAGQFLCVVNDADVPAGVVGGAGGGSFEIDSALIVGDICDEDFVVVGDGGGLGVDSCHGLACRRSDVSFAEPVACELGKLAPPANIGRGRVVAKRSIVGWRCWAERYGPAVGHRRRWCSGGAGGPGRSCRLRCRPRRRQGTICLDCLDHIVHLCTGVWDFYLYCVAERLNQALVCKCFFFEQSAPAAHICKFLLSLVELPLGGGDGFSLVKVSLKHVWPVRAVRLIGELEPSSTRADPDLARPLCAVCLR